MLDKFWDTDITQGKDDGQGMTTMWMMLTTDLLKMITWT